MRLLIFGATGATGRELVQQALARGHAVTAFVRDPARLTSHDASLKHVVGDVMSQASVDAAVPGHDAILCAIGSYPDAKADAHRRQAKTPVCSIGTRHILAAMTRLGARRIVVETAACIGESRKTGRFGAGTIVHLAMPEVMRDKELQESFLMESGLDWTIVRPAKLKDGARTGRLAAGIGLPWSLLSSARRSDVASFMLDALGDATTVHSAVTVRQASRREPS